MLLRRHSFPIALLMFLLADCLGSNQETTDMKNEMILMKEEINSLKQQLSSLNSKYSALEDRVQNKISVDDKTQRVMFSAMRTLSWSGDGSLVWVPIPFDTLMFNQPEGIYNTETGIFTVPTSGVYCFMLDCSSYNNRNLHVGLQIGEQVLPRTFDSGLNNDEAAGGTHIIQFVSEGTEVAGVIHTSASNNIRESYCIFSGYLLDAGN